MLSEKSRTSVAAASSEAAKATGFERKGSSLLPSARQQTALGPLRLKAPMRQDDPGCGKTILGHACRWRQNCSA